MTMYKKALRLLLVFLLLLGICVQAFAEGGTGVTGDTVVLEDKNLYKSHPLYIDLNLNANESADDDNFVVMQEGAAILYATSGMHMDVSAEKATYTLYNPSSAAKSITPGTPVAFIDADELQAYFFMPTQVAVQADRIVFTCDPQGVTSEQLFLKVGISVSKTFPFNKTLSYSNPAGTLKFNGELSGSFFVKVKYNGFTLEVESWVAYDLKKAVLEIKDNFSQEIPIAKIPFSGVPGLGLEVGVGLGLAVEGDTEISFEMTGGKTGFKGSISILGKPKFSSLSQKPALSVQEIIAEGDFEVDLTLGPSLDVFSVAGAGCDIAAGIDIAAELTGDEGGRPQDASQDVNIRPFNSNVWHVCKELSCVQGEIDVLAKLEAWVQLGGHVWSVHYDLFREKYSDFHYSFTFKEFALAPCEHYLYQVHVLVKDTENQPMKDVDVAYTEVPPQADRKGEDYIKGTTDENGYVHLYMPAGNVKITATSWQTDPDDPSGTAHVKKTVDYTVIASGHEQETVIQLPLYHYMELIYFDENANGAPVENMPQPFWVEEDHEGMIPNEVPRREGYQFVQWNTEKDGSGTKYFPGDKIKVQKVNIQLYAIWTTQPVVDFHAIRYIANGGVLADNPQLYYRNTDGFMLINPWRKDYVFTGWTCPEIGLDEPALQVTVQCNDPFAGSDFVDRTYVANWKHVTYNVIWRNWDGAWLDVSRDLAYQTWPSYTGPTPQRPSDSQYFYLFAGWMPELAAVTEDAEYTAVYNAYPLLKITSSPTDQNVLKGTEVTFTVGVTGGVQPYTYQWYMIPAGQAGEPSDGTGTAVLNANTNTLSVTADDTTNGNRYYCVVGDAVGQRVASEAATLSIDQPLLILVSSPQDRTCLVGEKADFAVSVTGGVQPYTYQWYVIPGERAGISPFATAMAEEGTAIAGAVSDTLTVTATIQLNGNRYYCVVRDAVGQAVESQSARLNVVQPAPQTGDHFPLLPLLILLFGSGAVLIFGRTARKRLDSRHGAQG